MQSHNLNITITQESNKLTISKATSSKDSRATCYGFDTEQQAESFADYLKSNIDIAKHLIF